MLIYVFSLVFPQSFLEVITTRYSCPQCSAHRYADTLHNQLGENVQRSSREQRNQHVALGNFTTLSVNEQSALDGPHPRDTARRTQLCVQYVDGAPQTGKNVYIVSLGDVSPQGVWPCVFP